MAPLDPTLTPPQPSRLTIALEITAIIALAVLIILAILFYLDYSQSASRQTPAATPTPTTSDGTQGTGSNSRSLPATQSGSSGNIYNEPAAGQTTDPQAYPLPNNPTGP
jgi:hypothetical protein